MRSAHRQFTLAAAVCFSCWLATPPAAAQSPRFSTFLGGSEPDWGRAAAIDSNGNILITGQTGSRDFPVRNAYKSSCTLGPQQGCSDAFITKLDPTGSTIIYSTYYGGAEGDQGNGIAVDAQGNAYVAGSIGSDAFLAKFAPDGRLLRDWRFSAYPRIAAHAIAVDPAGNIYLTGETLSDRFPVVRPLQPSIGAVSCTAVGGGSFPIDAFVMKISPNGSVVFSTFLGGSGNDFGRAIAVDRAGNVVVAGGTSSADFPGIDGLQQKYSGGEPRGQGQCDGGDGFVAIIDGDGRQVRHATYLGGTGLDTALSLTVDSGGRILAGGSLGSNDAGIPPVLGGPGFAVRLNPELNRLLYATRTPGLTAVADSSGFIYTGALSRLDPVQPQVLETWQIARQVTALAAGPDGSIVLAGNARTGELSTMQALQSANRGWDDGYVAKIVPADNCRARIVNAASFEGAYLAPDSLATVLGCDFASESLSASATPLPTVLAGVTVTMTDSSGFTRHAPLVYVSPGQINLAIPSGIAAGAADVEVRRDGLVKGQARLMIETAAPGLFSVSGLAAATAIRVTAEDIQAVPVFACDDHGCRPVEIDTSAGRVILSLYGTGLRSARELSVLVGGIEVPVLDAAAQSQYAGLDQVNIELPPSLAGSGTVEVLLRADGLLSNAVKITIL